MAKSIRISDRLYELADGASSIMHRSLAQQIEHWAELGCAIEAAGFTTIQIQQILAGDLRAKERAMMKLGLADQASMYLIPPALARQSKVTFPELPAKSTKSRPKGR